MGRPRSGTSTLLLACCLLASDALDSKDALGGWRASRSRKTLDQVESLVPLVVTGSQQEHPRVRSLRQVLKDLHAVKINGKSPFKSHTANGPRSGSSESKDARFPLPGEIAYQFGHRQPVLLDQKNSRLKSVLKRIQVPAEEDLAPESRLRWLSHGCLPESELLLLAIQQRLDVQQGGDRMALFLDSWRNRGPDGDESFYEALDRTAGTPEAVFFFDAMLGDFVGRIAGPAGKRWSRKRQHDRLQQAFLTYRQYRGLIEAVSYALVLPPDINLPARLSRYDYRSVAEGLLSLRHQVDLLVESGDGDVLAAINRIQGFLTEHPMPEELWDRYDPLSDLSALIRADIVGLVDRKELSTEELWQAQWEERSRIAESIRAACQRSVTN